MQNCSLSNINSACSFSVHLLTASLFGTTSLLRQARTLMTRLCTFRIVLCCIIAWAIAGSSFGEQLTAQPECKNGYISPHRRVKGIWNHNKDNTTIPGLADVLVTSGRVYAVINKKILLDKFVDWSAATWTFTFPVAASNTTTAAVSTDRRRLQTGDGSFSADGSSFIAPGITPGKDPHDHTLLVYTPLPPFLAGMNEEVLWHVTIAAQMGGHPEVLYSDVPFCVLPSKDLKPEKKMGIVSCTSIIAHAAMQVPEWVAYHLIQGFEHFYIYVDSRGLTLVRMLLAPYVKAGVVTIVDWLWPKEFLYTFKFQQAHQLSCFYRAKEKAQWVAFHDVDEYFQPMQTTSVAQFLASRPDLAPLGAIRVRSWFFGHKHGFGAWYLAEAGQAGHVYEDVCSLLTSSLLYRDSKAVASGREKLLVRPDVVVYMDVHMVTIGGRNQDVDPEKEMRVVHYKYGRDLEGAVLDDTMRHHSAALHAMLGQWCVL